MTKNFTTTIEGTEFELISMNRVKLQLYQVYALFEQKKVRFHMQVDDNNPERFYITDRQSCPEVYLPLEAKLSEAILKNGHVVPAV